MNKFGLDFGTTNSSISVSLNGKVAVLPIDLEAQDPRVVRSMLYFFRRELTYKKDIPKMRQVTQAFMLGDIEWEGEFKSIIGQAAIKEYLTENKNRKAGIRRKIFTGRWVRMRDMAEAKSELTPEFFEEVDYGTGRLLQALKSTLRTSYKGTTIFGKFFTVEELVATFIKNLKNEAEKQLGVKIEEMTIGRPVKFSEDPEIDQRAQNRLAVAIKETGIKKLKFEFEPVAAARQYISSLLAKEEKPKIILVFDFGGGTLDTAIVKLGDKNEVLSTNGVYIGGDLLNADIMKDKLWNYFGANTRYSDQALQVPQHIYEGLQSWYSIPNLNNPDTLNLLDRLSYKNSDPKSLARLTYLIKTNLGFEIYEALEQAKKELSTKDESRIIFKDGPIDLNIKISRSDFEKIIQPRVEEVRNIVLETLNEAHIEPEQINKVVRTGGSSLIPIFEKMLIDIFGKEKITLFETFTSIAAGLVLD